MSERATTTREVIGDLTGARTPVSRPVRSGTLQRACACGKHTTDQHGECTECRKKRLGLQRRAVGAGPDVGHGQTVAPPIVHEVLRSPGRPLDDGTRSFMESRFNHDFSGVRVHTDGEAAKSAHAVHAFAYTVGRDIVFGEGQYSPATSAGRKLLAHELTHTLQQSGQSVAVSRKLEVGAMDTPAEREADHLAERVESGRALPAPHERALPGLLLPKLLTTRGNFHDPNFCYRAGSPRDALHPDRSRVVAVMQAQIETPETCDGEVVLRTSVLQSDWGAASAEFETYGDGQSQETLAGLYRDSDAEKVDYEERFSLDTCHATFSRCHLITFYEGGTKYTFAEAGYRLQVYATSEAGGTVLHDDTAAPRLIVEPCNHVRLSQCRRS